MNVPREKKIQEALKRMRALKIYGEAIKRFEQSDKVMVCEPPYGALNYTENELKDRISEFEKENDALVYLVVRVREPCTMDSLLFVSDYPDEWNMDNDDIKENVVMTYTINHSLEQCSEFGMIEVQPKFGGLIRTA